MLRTVWGISWCRSNTATFALVTCCIALAATAPGTVAFADHVVAEVINAEGSSVPGCEATNACFIPPTVTIDVGGEVIWSNPDLAVHTVTSGVLAEGGPDGTFDSGLLVPGVDFSHTFDEDGAYPYFCLVHPWMAGVVVVRDDGATGSSHDVRRDARTGDAIVVLHMGLGRLVIEFFPEDAPNHVANFIELSRSGFYDNTLFHRIIPGFMIQGGDPHTKPDSGVGQDRWSMGGPDTTLDVEFNDIMHNRGIVSMARSSDPNSAGSQFFIVHQDSNFLDASYTVFGRLATAESYETLDTIAGIEVDAIDRPVSPDLVRIISAQVLTRDQVADIQDMDPPLRMQSGFEEPAPSGEYTSEIYNFSIKFPEGWVVQDIDSEGGPNLAAVSSSDAPIPPSIAVYIEEAGNHTLNTVRESKLADVEAMGDSLQIVNHELTTINNFDAFVLDATGIFDIGTGPFDIGYREVTIVSSGKIYTFLFSSVLSDYDSEVRSFSESLDSFTVLTVDTPEEAPAEEPDDTTHRSGDDPPSLSSTMTPFAAFLALAALTAGTEGALIAEYGTADPIYKVSSGSMRPALEVGDLVVISALVGFDEVEPGDIIVYNRPSDHARVIVHRAVLVTDDNPYTLRAKGDANPSPISGTDFPITEDDYIGKVVNVIRHHNASRISADDDPSLGMADAPVNIIVFSNPQCPSCIRFHTATLPALEEQYLDTGLAWLTYRDFPDRHTYPNTVNAAAAAECAGDQDKYWEYRDILSDRARDWGDLSRARALMQFELYTETAGLDRSKFLICLNGSKHVPEVISDYVDGVAYGVDAAPTLFMGNDRAGYYQLSGSRPYEEIQAVIHYVLGVTIRDVVVPPPDTVG